MHTHTHTRTNGYKLEIEHNIESCRFVWSPLPHIPCAALKNVQFGHLARPMHGGARRATTHRTARSMSTSTFTHARRQVVPAALIEKAVYPKAARFAHSSYVIGGR